MTCPTPRPVRVLAASALFGLLPTLTAQNKSADPAAPKLELPPGLPTWLIPVPGGTVQIGVPSEKLLDICREAVNSVQPDRADPAKVQEKLRRTVNELGRVSKKVDGFLLAKWPVKNSEYLHFIEKTKGRFPFGWWRYGCKDDYEKRIPDINKEFPKEGASAAVQYWARHWKDLPYKLQDENGKSIENQPVAYISWIDAMKFAGWVGMRLPTEAELTRAMRGDGDHYWPWGANKELGDKYSEKAKAHIRLASAKDQALKDVDTVPGTVGPYGHVDLFGQVWQYTAELGYGPLAGKAAFEAEWKKLMTDKLGKQLAGPPIWKDNAIPIKGGSYLSGGDPVQLHIDARIGIGMQETVESVGFRLAKSPRPGADMLSSLTRTDLSTALFAADQKVELEYQAGIERYEIGASGFPDAYHAVSVAPVNFLSREKSISIEKLAEETQEKPLLIGVVATTEKLADPALEAGIYQLLFRKKGQPKDLEEAIKLAYKDLAAAAKKKPKNGGEEPPPEEKDKEKKTDWKAVLTKYGLTEKDLEDADAYEKTKFIRMGDLVVPTTDSYYLFVDNDNKYRAALKRKNVNLSSGSSPNTTFSLSRRGDKELVQLKFGSPIQQGLKRVAEFPIELLLDAPPPPADKPWRIPSNLDKFIEEAETTANGGNGKEAAAPPKNGKPAEKPEKSDKPSGAAKTVKSQK